MRITEAIQQVVAIYPGRFHPFHKGHASVYGYLKQKYGSAYVATSNKVDPPKSPFSFPEKRAMMLHAGIPSDRIVQTKNPYKAEEILDWYNPETTAVVFAVSAKDMADNPRFSFAPKKDGSASYFQPLAGQKNLEPFSKHAYIEVAPTLDFKVLAEPMRSATELRKKFAQADTDTQKDIITDLYGTYNARIHSIMANKINEAYLKFEDLHNIILELWRLDVAKPLAEDVKAKIIEQVQTAREAWHKKYKRNKKVQEGDLIPFPDNTIVLQTTSDEDWYELGKDIANLSKAEKAEYGHDDSDTLMVLPAPLEKYIKDRIKKFTGLKFKDTKHHDSYELADIAHKVSEEDQQRIIEKIRSLTETIRKTGSQYTVYSKKGKRMGTYPSKKQAKERLRQIEYFKHVNEAFDSPYPLVWEGNPNGDSSALAEIPTSNGNTAYLDIEFNTSGDSGRFDISFTRNSRSKAAGTGDEFRVFATVIEAIKQWWNKVDQDRVVSITFSAAKNTNDSAMYRGAPDSPRRHILYSRFAKQFAKQIGFKLNIEDLGTGVYFFLTNPKSLSDNKLEEAFDTKVEWVKELGPSGSTVYATKVEDAYIELTYRPVSKGVYISFTRGGVMSVTGEGSQNKIFGAVINHIKQWAAKNKPEQIMFSAFKPRTGAFGSQDSTRSGLYRKMVQRFANQNGYEYDVEDTGNEDTFILKRQGVAEGKKTNKAFVKPQFDVEWEEAARYPEFQKIGKDAWIELAKKGKSVTIKNAKGINNTDAADPDSFKSLEPEKQKRALAQLEKGTVEMPIVAVYSDGYKELIGGNTRLTAMMARDGKATVWAFKVPDEVAKLAENFAEGKSPHKKGTKKYKAHMAAMHAGMNESYKLQLERDDDLLVLHIKDTKTGKRTEVRGKPNYEGDGYDATDPLHQLLDKVGKAANISELMNGEVVSINPRHPDGPRARKHADKAFNEDVAKDLEAEFPGLYLDLYKTKAGYILGKIELPKEERGEGIGTRVMQRIVDIADSEGEVVALTPDTAFGASSKGRLEKFYKRFGFVFNKGRNKDYSFRETMIRYPQGPQARATVKDIAGESIVEMAKKVPGEPGSYTMKQGKTEYKISPQLNSNDRPSGEWQIYVKDRGDWEWDRTVGSKRDAINWIKTQKDESINEAGVGRITKQNATKDAPIGSEFANVKKLGLGSGKPKELHAKARKNSDPNTLFNLGIGESKEQELDERGSITVPFASGTSVTIAPHRPLRVKKSTKGRLRYENPTANTNKSKRGKTV